MSIDLTKVFNTPAAKGIGATSAFALLIYILLWLYNDLLKDYKTEQQEKDEIQNKRIELLESKLEDCRDEKEDEVKSALARIENFILNNQQK